MAFDFVTNKGAEDITAYDQFFGNCVYTRLWNDYGGNYYYDNSIGINILLDAEEFCRQYDGICEII